MTSLQHVLERPARLWIGKTCPAITRHQAVQDSGGPVLNVVVQGEPLPGLSACHVCQDLLATRSVSKARQEPGIRSMNTLVKSATDETGTQLLRQPLQRLGISRADTPGTAEHKGDMRVRGEFFQQMGKPLEQGVLGGLIWAHVDATSGVPKHGFVVNYAVKIKIQNYVSAARRRRRDVRGRDACGHACHTGIFRQPTGPSYIHFEALLHPGCQLTPLDRLQSFFRPTSGKNCFSKVRSATSGRSASTIHSSENLDLSLSLLRAVRRRQKATRPPVLR